LPIIIWLLLSIGPEVRLFRTMMLDEINQDYVRTARSKGLSRNVVLFKHVLKNAMVPIITLVVLQIPFLFTGSLLLENFFGIPGLGSMTVNAIFSSDWPVLRCMTFIFSVLFISFNLISDVLYTLVDPRVRLK
jgi:peptide/nickel transport system permease protein